MNIKEIEKNVNKLLKKYDEALKSQSLKSVLDISTEIDKELSKLNQNEIQIDSKNLL